MKKVIYLLATVTLISCSKIKTERVTVTNTDTTLITETRSEIDQLRQEISVRDSQITDLNNKYRECISGVKRTESKQTTTNLVLSLILSVLVFATITILIKKKK